VFFYPESQNDNNMARGKKFNKRGGGPRLDAESAEEIEIRNARLAELEEERAARRAAEEDSDEDGDNEEGKELTSIDETKEIQNEPVKEKKAAAAEPPKAAVTTQAEHNKNMARLAEVRRRREEADARRKAEEEEAKQLEEERKKLAALAMQEAADSESKKSSKKVIPKLDKITIKKMKPAILKEALKERDLDYQGNAKQLQQRLLDYEAKR
jgi:hypothetical protein